MSKTDRRRDYTDSQFDTFARDLGRVTLAWNSLHLALFGVFSAVSGYGNRLVPGTIWHALKADRAQRDILKDFTQSNALGISIPAELRREIKWLVDSVNKIEDARNDFIHTPFAMDNGEVFALHLGQHKRGQKLDRRNIAADARWLFRTASTLTSYAEQIEEVIRNPQLPLSERPALPNRPVAGAS